MAKKKKWHYYVVYDYSSETPNVSGTASKILAFSNEFCVNEFCVEDVRFLHTVVAEGHEREFGIKVNVIITNIIPLKMRGEAIKRRKKLVSSFRTSLSSKAK